MVTLIHRRLWSVSRCRAPDRVVARPIDAVRTLLVLQDAAVPIIGPARKGERWEIHLNVFYTLRDERISTIKPNVISVQQAE